MDPIIKYDPASAYLVRGNKAWTKKRRVVNVSPNQFAAAYDKYLNNILEVDEDDDTVEHKKGLDEDEEDGDEDDGGGDDGGGDDGGGDDGGGYDGGGDDGGGDDGSGDDGSGDDDDDDDGSGDV